MTCYVFDKVHELEARLNTTDSNVASQSARLDELEKRILALESTPSPSPIPSPVILTVNSGVIFDVPTGFKSMTIKLKNVSNLPAWAPTVSFDGTTFHEQHRFGGSQLEVTIPILAGKYRLNKGGPDDFTADVIFNPEPNAQVLTLGQLVNYPFTSQSFDTTGFNTITITVGGGSNPQNLQAISLQKSEGGSFVEKQRLNCDGGAQCPLQSLPVLGGTYRVVLQGNGSAAVLGAILRK